MRKILIALAIIGLVNYTTTASAQKVTCSKYGQNFKVCKTANGYTICGQLTPTCSGEEKTNQSQNITEEAVVKQGKHSKYDINYPVCLNKDGYTTCTEEEALNQPITHAQPVPVDNNVPTRTCDCTVEHNGILVSYNDVTSCTAAMSDEQ